MTDIFLNVPFDSHYRPLFVALVVGVVGHGGIPRCVLELPASKSRLVRLKKLICSCPVSFHDLSRVQVSRMSSGTVPRFNMAFELGLAVMSSPRHAFFVLEEKPYRLQASLSDLNGFDPLIHKGNPEKLLEKMRDALQSRRHKPDLSQLLRVYDRVKTMVYADLRRSEAEFFSRQTFLDIVTLTINECAAEGLLVASGS